MWSAAWAKNAAHVVALTFAVAFFGALASAGVGVLSLSTVRAAAIAGVTAAVAALQSLIAPLVSQPTSNPTASLLGAVGSRIGSGPAEVPKAA